MRTIQAVSWLTFYTFRFFLSLKLIKYYRRHVVLWNAANNRRTFFLSMFPGHVEQFKNILYGGLYKILFCCCAKKSAHRNEMMFKIRKGSHVIMQQ